MMSQITKSLLVAALAASVAWAAPTSSASAQEIQITGPLAGAPAVRRLRQHRVGRVQIEIPTVGYTLQDEFARSFMVGLGAHVHFTDFLGIGVWGGMANFANAFQIDTDLTSQVETNGQTTDRNRLSMPSNTGFGDQVARLLGVASVHLIFAPLRGKLALFQGAFADTDFWILAGFTAAFVQERADVPDGSVCGGTTSSAACLDTQTASAVRFAPAPMIGVGLNLYFNEFLGMTLQWRAFPFDMNPSGTDESGQGPDGREGSGFPDGQIDAEDQRFYFHHMMNIGFVVNLPPEIQVSD